MPVAAAPKILTTTVGSYPIPDWLGIHPTRQAVQDAMRVVLSTQELAGIDVVTDGELYRFDVNHPETNGMIDYFTTRIGGIDPEATHAELVAYAEAAGTRYRRRPAGVVRQALDEGRLDLAADCDRVRALTRAKLKFTLTSPYMLAKVLMDKHYGGLRELTFALAEVLRAQVERLDADVVQIDEANLPGSPADGPWAAEAINRVLGGVKGERALHLCFGNYGGQSVQKGFWRDLIDFFNRLDLDHLVLEFARRGYDELGAFRDLKPEIKLGLGVIDIKDNEIESPDEVARRIGLGVERLGAERIRYVHPDCGLWMLKRSVADGKLASLAAGRDRFEGRGQ